MKLLNDYIQLTRLNRPIGIWLLIFPGFTGLSITQASVPVSYWILFLIGAIAMRSAGCIYNDMIDRKFDGKVNRTQNRPLVRKNTPLPLGIAFVFLTINLLVGLLCLLQFNPTTIAVGFVAAALIAAYPWMKRITYWPQLFLGFTMNMGFLIGLCAQDQTIVLAHLLIYLGMVAWTLGYDTIYGFQDIDDDLLIGVKSSTFKLKTHPRLYTFLIYIASITMWFFSGVMLDLTYMFFILLAIIALLLMWQALTLNPNKPINCLQRFKSNQWIGIVLWLAIIL
jgi:4-hydroxybenzoate polyprenyltransferase